MRIFILALVGICALASISGQAQGKNLLVYSLSYVGADQSTAADVIDKPDLGSILVTSATQGETAGDPAFLDAARKFDPIHSRELGLRSRLVVKTAAQRLAPDDAQVLLARLNATPDGNADQGVRVAAQSFTADDLASARAADALVFSAIVSNALEEKDGTFTASLVADYLVFSPATSGTMVRKSVHISNSGSDGASAMVAAFASLAREFASIVHAIEALKSPPVVLSVLPGGDVALDQGAQLGWKQGDEFLIATNTATGQGPDSRGEALVKIKEVFDFGAFATVLYGDGAISAGTEALPRPRAALEVSPFVNLLVGIAANEDVGFEVGAKLGLSWFCYDIRPIAELSLAPLKGPYSGWTSYAGYTMPVFLGIGGEYCLYLGRLRVLPSALAGLTAYWNISDTFGGFYFSHFTVKANAEVQVQVDKAIVLYVRGGVEYGFPIDASARSFTSIAAGVGIGFR